MTEENTDKAWLKLNKANAIWLDEAHSKGIPSSTTEVLIKALTSKDDGKPHDIRLPIGRQISGHRDATGPVTMQSGVDFKVQTEGKSRPHPVCYITPEAAGRIADAISAFRESQKGSIYSDYKFVSRAKKAADKDGQSHSR